MLFTAFFLPCKISLMIFLSELKKSLQRSSKVKSSKLKSLKLKIFSISVAWWNQDFLRLSSANHVTDQQSGVQSDKRDQQSILLCFNYITHHSIQVASKALHRFDNRIFCWLMFFLFSVDGVVIKTVNK